VEHDGERELKAGKKKDVEFHDDTSGVLETGFEYTGAAAAV
jgi:hypothetical protein